MGSKFFRQLTSDLPLICRIALVLGHLPGGPRILRHAGHKESVTIGSVPDEILWQFGLRINFIRIPTPRGLQGLVEPFLRHGIGNDIQGTRL